MHFTVSGIAAHESAMGDGNWGDASVFHWQARAAPGRRRDHVSDLCTVCRGLDTNRGGYSQPWRAHWVWPKIRNAGLHIPPQPPLSRTFTTRQFAWSRES